MNSKFVEIQVNENERWNKLVRAFTKCDVYYLSGYTKAFQHHGDGEPLLIYYEDDEIRGMNVVMKRDIATDMRFKGKIPPNTYFDLITPYG
ncbi:MAG: GNAT family N-acetyltransferase, partial [Oscillospiraceae bacterium]|nr:GNAT family N-acetyltransferase [Oscillospiraceae bacterium]